MGRKTRKKRSHLSNDPLLILKCLTDKISSNKLNTSAKTELYKMYIFTVLQLADDKISGYISPLTEELIKRLSLYFNKM